MTQDAHRAYPPTAIAVEEVSFDAMQLVKYIIWLKIHPPACRFEDLTLSDAHATERALSLRQWRLA